VGVAHQRDSLLLHQLSAFAVKAAGALDDAKLALDCVDTLADRAPVRLNLRFAGTAEKAEAAALPFQMRPGAHKPALLIGQPRQLHLQPAFFASRPVREDFENEPG